jgi:hypothetical protein
MDTLIGGGALGIGQQLQSNNGRYVLVMQNDGNLVLYAGPTVVWATNTWSLPIWLRPNRAVMQDDGNFVLYSPANNPAWASGTHDHPGSRIWLQDDRNLVIYDPNSRPLWASNTWIPTTTPATPVQVSKNEEVGWGKRMETKVTLYRNGQLAVDSFTKNDNWTGGLRGRILVVCVNAAGRAHWVSRIFECTTRCSVPDFSCASYGRETFLDNFPEPVGQYTDRLDIYQADNVSFVDLRNRTIDFIKAAGDIAAEIKAQLDRLTK